MENFTNLQNNETLVAHLNIKFNSLKKKNKFFDKLKFSISNSNEIKLCNTELYIIKIWLKMQNAFETERKICSSCMYNPIV